MRKYIERLFVEKNDLEGKIRKAKKVIKVPPYDMDKTQRMLLIEQLKIMEDYLSCLNERIEYEKSKY